MAPAPDPLPDRHQGNMVPETFRRNRYHQQQFWNGPSRSQNLTPDQEEQRSGSQNFRRGDVVQGSRGGTGRPARSAPRFSVEREDVRTPDDGVLGRTARRGPRLPRV